MPTPPPRPCPPPPKVVLICSKEPWGPGQPPTSAKVCLRDARSSRPSAGTQTFLGASPPPPPCPLRSGPVRPRLWLGPPHHSGTAIPRGGACADRSSCCAPEPSNGDCHPSLFAGDPRPPPPGGLGGGVSPGGWGGGVSPGGLGGGGQPRGFGGGGVSPGKRAPEMRVSVSWGIRPCAFPRRLSCGRSGNVRFLLALQTRFPLLFPPFRTAPTQCVPPLIRAGLPYGTRHGGDSVVMPPRGPGVDRAAPCAGAHVCLRCAV